ncbi:recombinase family protein [Clostridium sp. A1-XYC3]|uniref:Recombinase family protein n=1 Tax=Clostridium tanneri TaxID=3037988 RepID=A0ABU4JXG8_9CLOT|nr:recombinase family protein [Clostridium sp. A1-XYC3]MDW8802835.1 recombinase family protein [Clostridium sp. A1-XYC3]
MNVVGYVRLSRDEDKENYASIITQQDIINEFAKSRSWWVERIYIDDNCSGYTFDRPAFMKMKKDLINGKIDVIIAKDLSRLGRHNARTQLFIEEVRELGKRIILPEEGRGYDSDDEDDILGIKTWYNEMYVKDISRKIRSNMNSKQKKGELIMGNFYGYQKTKVNDKFILTVDEEIKPVIKLIFKLYIDGLGYKKICNILDEKGYPTPSEYIKRKHEEKGKVFKNSTTDRWQTHMIQRIIQNDIYIGTLRTKKRHSKLIKGKPDKVPIEEQYVFQDNHEAIISKKDFELAQSINLKRKNTHYRGKAKYIYLFSGFITCGNCGFAVVGKNLKKLPKIQYGYECTTYNKYGLKQCKSHAITEDKLLFFFKEFLKDVTDQYRDYINSIDIKEKKNDINKALVRLQNEFNIANEELKILLNQKIKDIIKESNNEYKKIIEHSYVQLENEKKKRINELSEKISELQRLNINNIENNMESNMQIFSNIINSDKPSRKLLELILEKIIIHDDKSLEFKLLADIDKLTYTNI